MGKHLQVLGCPLSHVFLMEANAVSLLYKAEESLTRNSPNLGPTFLSMILFMTRMMFCSCCGWGWGLVSSPNGKDLVTISFIKFL